MLDLRNHFFLPDRGVELRAFTHGPMPRTVPAMMHAFVDDWRERGVDAWNEVPNHWLRESGQRVGWWTLPEYLGDQFIAPMLGASGGSCLLMPNVHWIVEALLSCPELELRGRRVVATALEFPSVLHTLQRWKDVYGFELHVVPPTDDGFVDRDRVFSAINGSTALVIVSHVGFTSGEKLPDRFLRAIGERVHAGNGLLAIDGYHATGSVDVDVTKLDVDVYFGGLLKEGCGSSGNAYLYVRPGLDLSPRSSGWFGDAAPFAFAPSPQNAPLVRRRFMGGTPAVASMYHAVEGLRILLSVGLDQVQADSLAKTQSCIDRADELGLAIRSPREDDQRGAMVILEVERADLLSAFLKTRHVFTDSRQRRLLRMAPFVWNTLAEIDHAFELIGEAVQSGDYLTDQDGRSTGPVT